MCLNFGTPKIINFPFGTNGKLIILGVSIHKRIMLPACFSEWPFQNGILSKIICSYGNKFFPLRVYPI